MTEYIDGPAEEIITASHNEAYISFIELTSLFAENMATQQYSSDHGDLALGFRLTSWVEKSDSRFGNALIFSSPKLSSDTLKPVIEASLLKLDRENHVKVDDTKTWDIPLRPHEKQIEEYFERVIANFSEDEVRLVLAMLKKSFVANYFGQVGVLDGDVQLALIEDNLDLLASMYGDGAKSAEEEEPSGPKFAELLKLESVRSAFSDTYLAIENQEALLTIKFKDKNIEYLLIASPDHKDGIPFEVSIVIAVDSKFRDSYDTSLDDTEEEIAESEGVNPALLNEQVMVNILRSGRRIIDNDLEVEIVDMWVSGDDDE